MPEAESLIDDDPVCWVWLDKDLGRPMKVSSQTTALHLHSAWILPGTVFDLKARESNGAKAQETF